MKKRSILIVVLVLLAIWLYPQREFYEDGGTRTYSALLYKYIKRNVLVDCDDCVKPYYNEDQLILFPNNFKSLDEYWDENNINKIPKYQENQKEITITKGTTNKGEPVVVGKLTVDKDAKYSISHSGKGEIIDYFVQYDAGNYDEEKSLSFSNKNAEDVRKKVNKKQNPFYKDWKHDRGVHYSKKFGTLDIAEVDKEDGYLEYIVKKGDEKLYTSTKTMFTVQEPLKNLVGTTDDWWLLYDETQRHENPAMSSVKFHTRLIHNGEEVNVANAFALHNLGGKIFYFFKQESNSKIQFYLDGKIYDTEFDAIIHDLCCEPWAYNLQISLDGRLTFRGITGKKFTYNEMVLPGFSVDLEALENMGEEGMKFEKETFELKNPEI